MSVAPSSLGVRGTRWNWLPPAIAFAYLVASFAASDTARDRWTLLAVLLLVLVLSWFTRRPDVTLTETSAVVRNSFRATLADRWARRVAWSDVQAITREPVLRGYRLVLWTEHDRGPLSGLGTFLGLGRERLDDSFHILGQWWLAHRGDDWAPVARASDAPAVAVPPVRRFLDADGNVIAPPGPA